MIRLSQIGMLFVPSAMSLFTLSACAIALPFNLVKSQAKSKLVEGAQESVYIAVTHAVIAKGQLSNFNHDNALVLNSLKSQPGLIGYGVRFQLSGNQAWTMSIWESSLARTAFTNSPSHRLATDHAINALEYARFKNFEWPASRSRPDWTTALKKLEEHPRVYRPEMHQ